MFVFVGFFFFKQKTAYELRISDWSSDVCSSDLRDALLAARDAGCVVSFHVPDEAIQNSRAARELITTALTSSTPPQEFTLAVSLSGPTGDELFRDRKSVV